MKFTVTTLLAIISCSVYAGPAGEDVSKTCLQQAISLVNQLKADVFTDMDKSQSQEVLRLATGNCNKYFNNGNSNQANVNRVAGKQDASTVDEEKDWFTNYILNGEPADKEGNRRLKNLHK